MQVAAPPLSAKELQSESMTRVGIIEDDAFSRTLIERFLAGNRLVPVPLRSGDEVREAVRNRDIDVLLLDLGLPGEDGLNILLSVRAKSQIPVLVVSGRKEVVSITSCLDAGADDYVTKPISFEELGARLRSVMRRSDPAELQKDPSVLHLAGFNASVDLDSGTVRGPDGEATLTEREAQILALLHRAGGRPVSRAMLTRATLGKNWDFSIRTLDVHISNIRTKLASVGVPTSSIITARNLGYRLSPKAFPDEPA